METIADDLTVMRRTPLEPDHVAAIRALGKPNHVLYDLKYLLPAAESDLRL